MGENSSSRNYHNYLWWWCCLDASSYWQCLTYRCRSGDLSPQIAVSRLKLSALLHPCFVSAYLIGWKLRVAASLRAASSVCCYCCSKFGSGLLPSCPTAKQQKSTSLVWLLCSYSHTMEPCCVRNSDLPEIGLRLRLGSPLQLWIWAAIKDGGGACTPLLLR